MPFGKVTLNNAKDVRASHLLIQTADFKAGDVVNFEEIGKGVVRIKRYPRWSGYIKAAASTERKIDDAKKLVDLAVKVEKWPQYVFRKLIVEGLDINSEPEIRKMWAVKRGSRSTATIRISY